MAKTSVGVYLGPEYVDVIQIEGSVHNAKVLAFAREKIVDSSKTNQEADQASHEECISVAVSEALNKVQNKTGDVLSVLSYNNTVIRNFSMPKLPKAEQIQAILFEAKKYIPFNLTDITNDFKAINHPKDKSSMRIFFFASPKDRINKAVEIFNKAKSRVVGLDIIPFALFRGLSFLKKVSVKETVIVIYVD
ncbi:MAG: pilus assembly protein PilM, partial [Candidatus Omnitrophota bacterium]